MTSNRAGPLRVVLGAFDAGVSSLDDIVHLTALPRETVDAAVAHLVRIGRVSAEELTVGCPASGCGGCASGRMGKPGCGAPAPSPVRSGPVLVALSRPSAPIKADEAVVERERAAGVKSSTRPTRRLS